LPIEAETGSVLKNFVTGVKSTIKCYNIDAAQRWKQEKVKV
jgi:hypothetical protein